MALDGAPFRPSGASRRREVPGPAGLLMYSTRAAVSGSEMTPWNEGITGWNPSTTSARGSIIDRVRYASSAVTAPPPSRGTSDMYSPRHVGPDVALSVDRVAREASATGGHGAPDDGEPRPLPFVLRRADVAGGHALPLGSTEPLFVRGLREDDDLPQHARVRHAAVLGAVDGVTPRAIGEKPGRDVAPRDNVLLQPQRGYVEAVDDVARRHQQSDRPPRRHRELLGRARPVRVRELPHPLFRHHVDLHRPFGGACMRQYWP